MSSAIDRTVSAAMSPSDQGQRSSAASPVIRLWERVTGAARRGWQRMRRMDISTVMLIFAVFALVVVILALSMGPVHRRH